MPKLAIVIKSHEKLIQVASNSPKPACYESLRGVNCCVKMCAIRTLGLGCMWRSSSTKGPREVEVSVPGSRTRR